MSKEKKQRIGHLMTRIVDYVKKNPGCTTLAAAQYARPGDTVMQYGYQAVNRCIAAGLIRVTKKAAVRYYLEAV